MACFYNFFPVCHMRFPITYPHIVGEFALYERVRKKQQSQKSPQTQHPSFLSILRHFSRLMEEIKTPRISRGME